MRLPYKPQPAPRLILVPFLDMFTTILIFLIICFSPEESKIKHSTSLKLPASQARFLEQLSKVQVEVTASAIKINGTTIEGLTAVSNDQAAWQKFKVAVEKNYGAALSDAEKVKQPIILMADKTAEFRLIDSVVARLASIGFSSIYFLTETKTAKLATGKEPL